MHVLVIFIKNGVYVRTNSNSDAYRLQQFFKGIVFLILVFPLIVTTGVKRRGGTRTLIHHMWVPLSIIKIL